MASNIKKIDSVGIQMISNDNSMSVGLTMDNDSTDKGMILNYDLLTTPKKFSISDEGMSLSIGGITQTTQLGRLCVLQEVLASIDFPPDATTLKLTDKIIIDDTTTDEQLNLGNLGSDVIGVNFNTTASNTTMTSTTISQTISGVTTTKDWSEIISAPITFPDITQVLTEGNIALDTSIIFDSSLDDITNMIDNSSIVIGDLTDYVTINNSEITFSTGGTITASTFDGNATTSTATSNVTISDKNDNVTYYPTFVSTNTGNLPIYVDKTTNPLSYNPSTSTLTATNFNGLATNATNAVNASKVYLTEIYPDASTDYYIPFSETTDSNQNLKTSSLFGYDPVLERLRLSDVSKNNTANITKNKLALFNSFNPDGDDYDNKIEFNLSTLTQTIAGVQTSANWADIIAPDTGSATIDISNSYINASYYPTFTTTNGTDETLTINNLTNPLSYNPTTGTLTSTIFNGDLSGNATTSSSSDYATSASTAGFSTNATNATNTINVEITDKNDGVSYYPTFVGDNSGYQQVYVDKSTNSLSYTPASGLLTATTFEGALSGNATTATTSVNSSNAIKVTILDRNDNVVYYPTFTSDNIGAQSIFVDKTTNPLSYNPSTGTMTSTVFNGDLSGNATSATTSTNTTNIAITNKDDDVEYYPTFTSDNTGNLPLYVDKTTNPLSYNPSSGTITSTTFNGDLTGSSNGVRVISTGIVPPSSSDYVLLSSYVDTFQTPRGDVNLRFNPSTNVLTTTTFSGALAGNATTSTTSTNTTNIAITDKNDNVTYYPTFTSDNTGNLPIYVDKTTNPLSYNPSTGTMTSTVFNGDLSGNATSSTNTSQVTVTDAVIGGTYYPTFTQDFGANQDVYIDKTTTPLTYNPISGVLTSVNFTGALTGNATSSTNITGGSASDLLYQSATNTTSKLPIGTSGQVLTVNSSLEPIWASATGGSQTLSDVLTTGNTATNSIVLNNIGTGTNVISLLPNATSSNPTIVLTDGFTTNTIDKNGYTTLNTNANLTHYLTFVDTTTTSVGAIQKTSGVTLNPNSNTITATTFSGALSGNATTSTSTSNITIADKNDNVTYYPTFTTNNTGNLPIYVDKTTNPLSYNPSTGTMSSTTFNGALSGNATSSTNITGGSANDLLYQSATNTTSKLPIGTLGQVLTVNSSLEPSWETATGGSQTLTDVLTTDNTSTLNIVLQDSIPTPTITNVITNSSMTMTNPTTTTVYSDGLINMYTSTNDTTIEPSFTVITDISSSISTTVQPSSINIMSPSSSSVLNTSSLAITAIPSTENTTIESDSLTLTKANGNYLNLTDSTITYYDGVTTTPITTSDVVNGKAKTLSITESGSVLTYYPLMASDTGNGKTVYMDKIGAYPLSYNTALGVLTCPSFNGAVTSASGVVVTGTAVNTNYNILFTDVSSGTGGAYIDNSVPLLTYNPSTNTISASNFSGNASSASNITIADKNDNVTYYPTFTTDNTGNLPMYVDKTTNPLSYNPSSGVLTSTSFSGSLSLPTTTMTLRSADQIGYQVVKTFNLTGQSLNINASKVLPASILLSELGPINSVWIVQFQVYLLSSPNTNYTASNFACNVQNITSSYTGWNQNLVTNIVTGTQGNSWQTAAQNTITSSAIYANTDTTLTQLTFGVFLVTSVVPTWQVTGNLKATRIA